MYVPKGWPPRISPSFEDEINRCVDIDINRIDAIIEEEVDRRFNNVSCFIFVNDNGEECLQFYPESDSDLAIKVVKLSEIERLKDWRTINA